MGLLDALGRGFWGSIAEPWELAAGGAGLLESLIPGDRPDDPLERFKEWTSERAEGVRHEAGVGESEGLMEKIAEGESMTSALRWALGCLSLGNLPAQ